MLLICVAIEASVPIACFSILEMRLASVRKPGAYVIPSTILLWLTFTISLTLKSGNS
jgi:hypothetical protein